MRTLTLLLPLLLISSPARADLITFEPDDYAAGSTLTHALQGVTVQTMTSLTGGGFELSDVFARHNPACDLGPCDAVTGSQGFARTGDDGWLFGQWGKVGGYSSCFGPDAVGLCNPLHTIGQVMLITFDTPTDHVDISGAFNMDYPWLLALNAPDAVTSFIEHPRIAGAPHRTSTVSLNSSSANITRVLAGSIEDAASLDQLRFNVPEPSTLLLVGLGCLTAAARLRRRQTPPSPSAQPCN